MSRFADPRATRTVELGACECPGTPHSTDWIKVRGDLSAQESAILLGLPRLEPERQAEVIAPFVVEWNLIGPDDEDWPVTPENLFLLKGDTSEKLGLGLADSIKESGNFPNLSGSPSRASRRGRASRTQTTTRTPGT